MKGFVDKEINIVVVPIFCAVVFSLCVGIATLNRHTGYEASIFMIIAIVIAIWAGLVKSIPSLKYKGNLAVLIMYAGLVVAFFVLFYWGKYYYYLFPIDAANDGIVHQDTYWHSMVAESILRNGKPYNLLNEDSVMHYHTLYAYITAIIEKLSGISAFIVFNYIYPIVIIPLYLFLQFFAVYEAKRFFESGNKLSEWDIIIIMFYNIGLYTPNVMEFVQIRKANWIISPSFLIGNTLAFAFYGIIFLLLDKIKVNNENYKNTLAILLGVVIPMGIVLCSWGKISVGCVFSASVMYYIFRTQTKKLKYWVINGLYFAIFVVCIILFHGTSAGEGAHLKQSGLEYVLENNLEIHWLAISTLTIVFLVFDLWKNRYDWEAFLKGKTIWIEEVIVLTVVAFLPICIMKNHNGKYFSIFIETPVLILLLGKDYICAFFHEKKNNIVFIICSFVWAVLLIGMSVFTCKGIARIGRSENDTYERYMEIRKTVENEPEKYTIYFDYESDMKDADRAEGLRKRAIFMPVGLTGVGIINASYRNGDTVYLYTGETPQDGGLGFGYGLDKVEHGKLTFSEAKAYAKEQGRDYLIYIKDKDYSIIRIE